MLASARQLAVFYAVLWVEKMHEKWYSRNYKSMPVRGIYRMKEKLRLLLRKPAVIALLIAELLVIGFALAAALRPAAVYTFTADQWENIAQESEIGYDEDGRIGVTEMTDGEDILQTPAMTLPKGHYKVTLDYRYVPSVWEGGVERRSCVYFTSYDAVPPDVQQGSVLHMAEGCWRMG